MQNSFANLPDSFFKKWQNIADLLQYTIEHTRSAIALHDKDFRYIYVSKRYLKEFKVKEKDILGKHHYDVFPDLPQKWGVIANAGKQQRYE